VTIGPLHPPQGFRLSAGPERFELLAARGVLAPPGQLDDVGRGVELRRLLQQRQINPRSCLCEVGYRIGIGTRFASHIPTFIHTVHNSTIPRPSSSQAGTVTTHLIGP
jgi:hypothetical protein